MPSDLQHALAAIRIFDTHEHMHKESTWLTFPADILQVLFHHYIQHDLQTAGLRGAAFDRLFPKPAVLPKTPLAERWQALEPFWQRCQHTGYGEATRYTAETVFGLKTITLPGLEQAQKQLVHLQRPGQRLRLLRDVAKLDHIQIDDFVHDRPVDASGPDFFLYDLSCLSLCCGQIDAASLHAASGITVKDLPSLDAALEVIFERHAPSSVAIKSQHAYSRTLAWEERTPADTARALQRILKSSPPAASAPSAQSADAIELADRNCLGDWCWDRVASLCAKYHRPFKIHTGYYAGNDRMPLAFVEPGQMHRLLAKHLDTTFVLMHTAYPFGPAIVALAKHFRNVYADLCWAWSVDPYRTSDFVRSFLHAVPVNKLFAFGGDTFLPTAAVGFTCQARRWLTYTLEQEIAAGSLNETQAIAFAEQVLAGNQAEVFDLTSVRAAVAQSAARSAAQYAAE